MDMPDFDISMSVFNGYLWSRNTKICTDYIRLRYALIPYIYSLSGLITHHNYTPMRLLAFDFPEDSLVYDCKDEFMYGPSLLRFYHSNIS
ncbi:hypothetical protein FACS1894174_00770 [Bacteroidia bacterium]|nr:hypothetical protein FACS1894174_00770 [Bacteroidia bacterium]